MGVQLLGAFIIIVWVGSASFLLFYIMDKFQYLRLESKDEVLGGDIYYFAPIQFTGNPEFFNIDGDLSTQQYLDMQQN